jgi:riboflavin kinase/FMN adenylyltransferase
MIELHCDKKYDKPLILGLGFFDCVHAGHRELIKKVVSSAKETGCVAALSTFSNNPYRLFNPDAKVINLFAERAAVMASLGIEAVIPFTFDAEFKKIDRKDFLDKLFNNFRIKRLVCGYDYLFGFKGAGDAEYLKLYAVSKGADVIVEEPVLIDGERVSSTAVKEALQAGEIEKANKLLAAPFFMTGTVSDGFGRGREMGYPTANLSFKKSKLTPKDGVYKTAVTVKGRRYDSVTNVGAKPTFSDASKGVETYIDGFDGRIYGEEIKIEFIKRIRDVQRFGSAAELKARIAADLKA